MEQAKLKPCAVIFDVYKTLLEVGAGPLDAEARWTLLCGEYLPGAVMSRAEFLHRAEKVIARQHRMARGQGIAFPEIQWPQVVLELIPALAAAGPVRMAEFILQQMTLDRTLRIAKGAEGCLRELIAQGIALGIASNSQAYTLLELDAALRTVGLELSLFDRQLCFWSFEHGFSKPDPHVFRILTARLEARGIAPSEILMVGDRLDNDIDPARAQGWRVWHLETGSSAGGGFAQLREALDASKRGS